MAAEFLKPKITLRELLAGMADAPAIAVTGIATDSRRLHPGDLFLACQGATSHGLDFLDQAVAAGVAAVAWDASASNAVTADVAMIPVCGLSRQIGEIANRWFDSPSRELLVTGVTGTNGKTTVAYLIRQCMRLLQHECGYVGTLGGGLAEIVADSSLTTPACIELHALLAEFRDQGARHAAIEVSSHAIDQSRVDGIQFDTAIFTNLSRDHIDYHGGIREYFESKASLFLDNDVRNRIVSLDTEFGAELAIRCAGNVITVSTETDRFTNASPHIAVTSVASTPTGSVISVATSWGQTEIRLPLPGAFNVINAAQVLAHLLCHDVTIEDAARVLGAVSAPPGRMQQVPGAISIGLPSVYVDYSHTPASLEAALGALRGYCSRKLWCVFGCGGDRDRGKRSLMGEVADRMADIALVTSDNPRTEVPAAIIADIVEGMHTDTLAIENRRAAIAHAIADADPGDTILIAGKGHEDYQIVGAEKLHFSDLEVAAENLAMRAGLGVDNT